MKLFSWHLGFSVCKILNKALQWNLDTVFLSLMSVACPKHVLWVKQHDLDLFVVGTAPLFPGVSMVSCCGDIPNDQKRVIDYSIKYMAIELNRESLDHALSRMPSCKLNSILDSIIAKRVASTTQRLSHGLGNKLGNVWFHTLHRQCQSLYHFSIDLRWPSNFSHNINTAGSPIREPSIQVDLLVPINFRIRQNT